MTSALHWAKRFVGSLRSAGPDAESEAWAQAQLLSGEVALWNQMPGFDRRHAVGVAHEVDRLLGGQAKRPVLAAALLHDVGKIDSGLGVFARVGATIWKAMRGFERVAAGDGRVARYVRHPQIGADLLTEAGSAETTIAWAREHHRPESAWSVPLELGRALKAADDD